MNIEHTIQQSYKTLISNSDDKFSRLFSRDTAKGIVKYAKDYLKEFYEKREPMNNEKDFLLHLVTIVGSIQKVKDEDKKFIFDSYNELARRYGFTSVSYQELLPLL